MTVEHPIAPEHFDVLIVGAGLSGIGATHALHTHFKGKRYAILGQGARRFRFERDEPTTTLELLIGSGFGYVMRAVGTLSKQGAPTPGGWRKTTAWA